MLVLALGYLLGSVPFAFLLARRAGVDVRVAGSRNVGATNVLRTAGTRHASVVLALDAAKGAGAVALAYLMGGEALAAPAGFAAVVGHIYPVWLRFHGGKGVAVATGVFAVLTPEPTAIAAVLFIVIVWLTRHVSLGSIAASLALPPMTWLAEAPPAVVGAATGSAALILFRHRVNIRMLRQGTERKLGRDREL